MSHISSRFWKRIAIWIVAPLTLTLAVSTVGLSTASAAPKPPKIINTWSPPPSKSIYNVPKGKGLGSPAQVTAYVDELVRAIGATPSGETIRVSTFLTSYWPVINALISAHVDRKVHVKFVTWNKDYKENKRAINKLKKVLGTNVDKPSYVKICHKSCYSGSGTQHVKLVLISTFIDNRGKGVKNAAFIASGNISIENVVNSWNHAQLIVGRKKLYNGLKSYFDGMRHDRTHKNFKPVTDGPYTAFFYPTSTQFNPFFSALEHTSCKAKKGHGIGGRTIVRVIMYLWRDNTSYKVQDRLKYLQSRGCDVGVIVSQHPSDAGIVKSLVRGHVRVYNARAKGRFVHAKMGFISGTVGGKSVDMVVTGSLNFTRSSMVDCTDIALRIHGKTWFNQALNFYNDIASHSRKV